MPHASAASNAAGFVLVLVFAGGSPSDCVLASDVSDSPIRTPTLNTSHLDVLGHEVGDGLT
jgi:hypothetical protein